MKKKQLKIIIRRHGETLWEELCLVDSLITGRWLINQIKKNGVASDAVILQEAVLGMPEAQDLWDTYTKDQHSRS